MDPEFLKILVCPLSGGSLEYDPERCELISAKAGVAYPVLDGIPVLCTDAARPLAGEPDPSPPPIMTKEAKAKEAKAKEAKAKEAKAKEAKAKEAKAKEARAKEARAKEAKREEAMEEEAGGAVAGEKPPGPSEADPGTTPG